MSSSSMVVMRQRLVVCKWEDFVSAAPFCTEVVVICLHLSPPPPLKLDMSSENLQCGSMNFQVDIL